MARIDLLYQRTSITTSLHEGCSFILVLTDLLGAGGLFTPRDHQMSKGPGRIQRAVYKFIAENPDGAINTRQILECVHGEKASVGNNHLRFAVTRALQLMPLPEHWFLWVPTARCKPAVLFNAKSKRSTLIRALMCRTKCDEDLDACSLEAEVESTSLIADFLLARAEGPNGRKLTEARILADYEEMGSHRTSSDPREPLSDTAIRQVSAPNLRETKTNEKNSRERAA